ncbi:MAG: CehA/McbA family metallohydrolase [Deltaproteobacteria bacterium]|nr:CehA/McbA family metallohydrolase [Deltaproteobacteria bacterium]
MTRPDRSWWLGALALAACSGEAAPTAPTAPTGMNPPAYAALGAATQDGGAPLPAPRGDGTLRVRVHDDRDQPVPCRLTFAGVGRTPTPRFTTTDIGREQQGGILAFDRAFLLDDAELELPVGEYDVWVSHGPEWDIATRRVTIATGAPATLTATLRHVVDTSGWISGDFHVHAEESSDSRVPMRDRVHQFVADGVDLIVATDHNVIADYAPIIDELRQGARLASLQGDEITTRDWGHFGAFPLPADEAEAGHGAIPVKGHTPADLFADVRRLAPDAIIDIHHPRLDDGQIGYFHLGKLDPLTLRAARPGFSLDFDAIEVLNGYQDADRKSLALVLEDWFAFLRHGRRVTATGNSDTHHLTYNLGGYPRNYVQVADDRPDHLDPAALVAAVKAGRAYFTTGPIVDVSVGAAGLGDTVVATRGAVAVHVRVRAPAWIAVDRITILRDGAVVERRTSTRRDPADPVRFDETITVPVKRDGFLVVRVDGDRSMAPVIGDAARFPVFPLAITNPIWVDADGDGAITPGER